MSRKSLRGSIGLGLAVGILISFGNLPSGAIMTNVPDDVEDDPLGVAGAPILVAAVTYYTTTWSVYAYNADGDTCIDMQSGFNSGGGCGFGVPLTHKIGLVQTQFPPASTTLVYGLTSTDVTSVVIFLSDGRTVTVSVSIVPQLTPPVGAFWWGDPTKLVDVTRAEARNAVGNTVETATF